MSLVRRFPWVPGAVIGALLWLWAFTSVDFASDAQSNIDSLWQSLGSGALASDPLRSIQVLHTQPPLLNVLFAVDLAVSPSRHMFLLLVNLASMIASIALVVDTLIRVGVHRHLAGVSGILLALLPGTVAYSLWVYNVTITGFFSIAAVWGIALARTRFTLGITISAGAALCLMLTRTTFAIPFLIGWLIALGVWAWLRGEKRSLLPLGTVLLLGCLAQAHYLSNFGIFTMSSWSGQYVLEATRTSGVISVLPSARQAISEDPCSSAALGALEEGRLNLWDPGGLMALPECSGKDIPEARGVAAWDEQFKLGSKELNLNWRYGLAASRVWTDVTFKIIREDPIQLVRMAVAPSAGVQASGVARYLSRSENYPWIAEAVESLPFANMGAAYSTLFAPLAWLAAIVGWAVASISRRWRRQTAPAFWFGSVMLVFHVAASTLLVYAEAMRFRAEVDPLLVFVAASAVWYLWSWWPRRQRAEIEIGTSRGSVVR